MLWKITQSKQGYVGKFGTNTRENVYVWCDRETSDADAEMIIFRRSTLFISNLTMK